MLEDHLKRLSSDLGMKEIPQKNDQGIYSWPFEPNIDVAIKEQNPGVFLYATLGPCPQKRKEDLFIRLMEANFMGQGTRGAVIGLEEDMNLSFSLDLSHELEYSYFFEQLEEFVNYVDFWRSELTRFGEESNALFSGG